MLCLFACLFAWSSCRRSLNRASNLTLQVYCLVENTRLMIPVNAGLALPGILGSIAWMARDEARRTGALVLSNIIFVGWGR
ncbi:hypothetical protein B0T22DRAFT_461513 [Podospora appendiculata]|uniref:Uncharacterized protein n=1 Tax=Podospora appendiculata TaxID=314037 RepID=A0AAE0XBT9_9PEZI|nr:hypothetical protein B0T22DRAFT_461513 [Podospora appendiculata]